MARTFKVKDWEEHQHYKDRNPPWIRFYARTLDNYEIAHLPDAAKAHLFGIWLLASRYENAIPYDAEWIAKKINATEPVDLEQLAIAGLIIVDGPRTKTLARRKQVDVPEESISEHLRADPHRPPKGAVAYSEDFSKWWEAYPHKIGKDAAWRAWQKAFKRVDLQTLIDAAKRYIATKPQDREWCNPATWLNQGRWQDAPASAAQAAPETPVNSETSQWEARCLGFLKNGFWMHSQWGPAPGESGCRVPPQIIVATNADGLTPPPGCNRMAS